MIRVGQDPDYEVALLQIVDPPNDLTAAELGDPIGVNIAKDNLSFFPLLYWPITAQQKPLPENAVAKLNQFMRNGGTIFIDTRDKNGIEHASILRVLAAQLDLERRVRAPERFLQRRLARIFGGPGAVDAERPGRPGISLQRAEELAAGVREDRDAS